MTWQFITEDTERLRVPGGWLYRTAFRRAMGTGQPVIDGSAMTFVAGEDDDATQVTEDDPQGVEADAEKDAPDLTEIERVRGWNDREGGKRKGKAVDDKADYLASIHNASTQNLDKDGNRADD